MVFQRFYKILLILDVQVFQDKIPLLIPTLCLGMHPGRFASRVLFDHSRGRKASQIYSHAKRGNKFRHLFVNKS